MQRPFGYEFTLDGYVQEYEPEYRAVRFAVRLRRERRTLREIADILSEHYSNRAGGPFNATQVHRMIAREARYKKV